MKRNKNIEKLSANYLFFEIAKRKEAFLKSNPGASLISLGIGDTTEPVPPTVSKALEEAAHALGTVDGYSGYGPANGVLPLRQAIADVVYSGCVSSDDIFISDGSKCDIARIQMLLGPEALLGVQDPTYPAYVGSGTISGKKEIKYFPCTPENDFFPNLNGNQKVDALFFCSPNNPTGTVATRNQLNELVAYAKKNKVLIIYDSAYAFFIQNRELPKSIFEIPGAEEVAIETGSFSKFVGFTGVRLGWTVVPRTLRYDDGTSIRDDWMKVVTNCFNGACNIAQSGGIEALKPHGIEEAQKIIAYYQENSTILGKAIDSLGYRYYGGKHAPYLWIDLNGESSWDAFDRLLHHAHVVTTPGAGFGESGEGFLRLSAFGHRRDIENAAGNIVKVGRL